MDENKSRLYLTAMGIPVWLLRTTTLDPDAEAYTTATAEDTKPVSSSPTPPVIAASVSEIEVSPVITHLSQPDILPTMTSAFVVLPPPIIATIAHTSELAASSPSVPPIPTQTLQPLSILDIDQTWEQLITQVNACCACEELVNNRSRIVFGTGNRAAKLLVIGEAPGADEDQQGEPFVGRAGRLLNSMLQAIGLQREDVYIANILKCRPPKNRDPSPTEASCCESWLLQQIKLVNPLLILAVGSISAQNLLKTQISVGKLRGQVHEYGTQRIPLIVTYHPAYLLRSPGQKAEAWKDLQIVMRILRRHI